MLSWMRKNLPSPGHPHRNRTLDADAILLQASHEGFACAPEGAEQSTATHPSHIQLLAHSHIVHSEVSVCSKLCGHRSNGGAAKCSSCSHMLCSLRGHHTSHSRHIHIATLGPCVNLTAAICLAKCKKSLWG